AKKMKKTANKCVINVSNKGRGAGRPTLYTPKVVNALVAALAEGLTIGQACAASGIGVQTLSDWKDRYPQLKSRLEQARERARRKSLATISAAAESGDWRAAVAFLRLSFPADYRRESSININATATAQKPLVINEAMRNQMIADRAAMQARQAT